MKAMKRWLPAVLAAALLLPLSGCWSRHELNDLAIVVGLGIDRKGDLYEVSTQIVNPAQVSNRTGMGKGGVSPVVTFTQQGKSVPEALRRMTTELSKRLYFSHLRIVVFGERIAREGIGKPLDYISRDSEMRNDFYLVVARECQASEILKLYSPIDPIPANNMYTKLSNSDKLWAAAGNITLDRLTKDLAAPGKNPTLTGIRITGNRRIGETQANNHSIEPKALLEYSGMAAFRKDRMVGWLDENGTKTLNYLQDQVHQTLGVVPCPEGGIISLAIMRSDTRVEVQVEDKAQALPRITVHTRIEENVASSECELDLSRPSTIDWIRQAAERQFVDLVQEGIKVAQQDLKSDIFGFGDAVHRQQPALWHRIDQWDDTFPRVKVVVKPEVLIRRIGTIGRPLEIE